MNEYAMSISEKGIISHCPKCRSYNLISRAEGGFACLDCGYQFFVVEVKEGVINNLR